MKPLERLPIKCLTQLVLFARETRASAGSFPPSAASYPSLCLCLLSGLCPRACFYLSRSTDSKKREDGLKVRASSSHRGVRKLEREDTPLFTPRHSGVSNSGGLRHRRLRSTIASRGRRAASSWPGEIWRDMTRCGEIWADMGRDGESRFFLAWGDMEW